MARRVDGSTLRWSIRGVMSFLSMKWTAPAPEPTQRSSAEEDGRRRSAVTPSGGRSLDALELVGVEDGVHRADARAVRVDGNGGDDTAGIDMISPRWPLTSARSASAAL